MLFGYMDVNKLLQLVAMRRPLWYKKGTLDREEVQKLWNEVGVGMNTSGYIARLKWQNLRDTFRKEVTKLKRSRELDIKYVPTWKHFHQMGFVLELVDEESWLEWKQSNPAMYALAREKSNHAPPSTSSASDQSEQHNLTISSIVSLQEAARPIQTVFIDVEAPPIKVEEELEEDSMQPMTSLDMDDNVEVDTGEDEDYHFLMSLLPHLKEISKSRKLYVRQKLQQVIIDEMQD